MSKDGNLRRLFRSNLREFFWTSVETFTEPGIPDSFFCFDGVSGWIEFKQTTGNKIASLTPQQIAWHARLARKGGRSFFAVRRCSELILVEGARGSELREGLAFCQATWWKSPWPWREVAQVLTTSGSSIVYRRLEPDK
jgi:hypothetical protein